MKGFQREDRMLFPVRAELYAVSDADWRVLPRLRRRRRKSVLCHCQMQSGA